jgi:hypothetical protein
MTNRLKPIGGVTSPISTTSTMKTPNQMGSKPAAITSGKVIGIVMRIMATLSSTQPRRM